MTYAFRRIHKNASKEYLLPSLTQPLLTQGITMTDKSQHCHGCGHFGTRDCATAAADTPGTDCNLYLSWSELWNREMAAIDRAQRASYTAAGILAVMAIAAIVLPRALG